MDKIIDIAMHTPKRKKLCSTVQYIYQALFVEGRDSDVTVVALDEEFALHKVYLGQSPYFASMFGGNWKETGETRIEIDVVDPLITKDALRTVLGALYSDELHLEPLGVVSVLAAATMLQLNGVIERCGEVMLETINPHTALHYYDAACQYGDVKLRDQCVQWFLLNLMMYYNNSLNDLRTIPVTLMEHLVGHPGLCVMKTEITLYVLLSQWMYLQTHPECDESIGSRDIAAFYCNRSGQVPYLLTEEGACFEKVFRALRIQHLIAHHMDVELLLRDNIVPRMWLDRIILQGWKCTLRINQNEEKGPDNCSDETFLNVALRCGRILTTNEKHMWRWTGFHYGLDLIMIADENSLSVKRNHRPEFEQLLSLQGVRHIIIRVSVYALNEQKQITFTQCSGIHRLALHKSEEVTLIKFPPDIQFPLVLSANVLYTSPFEARDESVQSI